MWHLYIKRNEPRWNPGLDYGWGLYGHERVRRKALALKRSFARRVPGLSRIERVEVENPSYRAVRVR